MKCIDCLSCKKGWFANRPDSYTCIGVKEPFSMDNANHQCTEYSQKYWDERIPSGKYNQWVRANIYNANKVLYKCWRDDSTYVIGAYDKTTGKGVERVFKLAEEYEVDKTAEIEDDVHKYQE